MEGHRETQQRMSNPALNWLRDVALAVRNAGKMDKWLRAHNILDLVANWPDIEIPGTGDDSDLEDDATRQKALCGIGRRLGLCFDNGTNEVEIGDMTILRQTTQDDAGRDRNEHLFKSLISPSSPEVPPSRSPIKTPISLSPAMDPIHSFGGDNLDSMGKVGIDAGTSGDLGNAGVGLEENSSTKTNSGN